MLARPASVGDLAVLSGQVATAGAATAAAVDRQTEAIKAPVVRKVAQRDARCGIFTVIEAPLDD